MVMPVGEWGVMNKAIGDEFGIEKGNVVNVSQDLSVEVLYGPHERATNTYRDSGLFLHIVDRSLSILVCPPVNNDILRAVTLCGSKKLQSQVLIVTNIGEVSGDVIAPFMNAVNPEIVIVAGKGKVNKNVFTSDQYQVYRTRDQGCVSLSIKSRGKEIDIRTYCEGEPVKQ